MDVVSGGWIVDDAGALMETTFAALGANSGTMAEAGEVAGWAVETGGWTGDFPEGLIAFVGSWLPIACGTALKVRLSGGILKMESDTRLAGCWAEEKAGG